MAAKGKKFSFTRFITNAVPNMANDAKDDVDMTPEQADLLFRYQLSLPSPPHLGPLSFQHAGITPSPSISTKIHKNLLKHSIISPCHSTSPQTSGIAPKDPGSVSVQGVGSMTVDTSKLGRDLPGQVAFVSVHAQRKLVGMLFVWEEECVRWRLLGGEEGEIKGALEAEERAGVERDEELEMRLRAVRMKMWLPPSERGEGTANVGKGKGEVLPGYQEGAGTA